MPIRYVIKWTRRGRCNQKACRAACCRALNLLSGSFNNDNATKPSEENIAFTNARCSQINELSDSFDCAIYKNRPSVCKDFPASPWDLIYRRVKRVCSYWFEIEIIKEDIVSPNPDVSPDASPSPDKEDDPTIG
jgi:hypothetical protein